MKTLFILPFLFVAFCICSYLMNLYKLFQLDFASPYKAEVIRVVGVFTPIGVFTGFFTFDEERN